MGAGSETSRRTSRGFEMTRRGQPETCRTNETDLVSGGREVVGLRLKRESEPQPREGGPSVEPERESLDFGYFGLLSVIWGCERVETSPFRNKSGRLLEGSVRCDHKSRC